MTTALLEENLRRGEIGVSVYRCLLWTHRMSKANAPRLMGNHLIIYGITGDFLVRVDGVVHRLGGGDCLWIPPGCERQVVNSPGGGIQRDFRLHLDLTYQGEPVLLGREPLLKKNLRETEPYFQLLSRLTRENRGREGASFIAAALALDFLSRMERAGREGELFTHSDLNEFQTYVLDHLLPPPTPADLARLAGLSPDYFSRKFFKSFNVSPRRFIGETRLGHAAVLLGETEERIGRIALESGFEDANLFSRSFKALYRVTPREYRRLYRIGDFKGRRTAFS